MIKQAISLLIKKHPYYGLFSRNLNLVASHEKDMALAVCYKNRQFNLIYNPTWTAQFPVETLVTGVQHECMHIIFKHLDGNKVTKFDNICMDLEINSFLSVEHLAEMKGVWPGRPSKDTEPLMLQKMEKLPPKLSRQAYALELREFQEAVNNQQGKGPADDVQPAGEEETYEDDLEDLLRRTWLEAQRRGWTPKGDPCQGMFEELGARVGALSPVISWQDAFERLISYVKPDTTYSSWRRTNKKYPGEAPGIIRLRKPRVLVAIDESGSVGDDLWVKLSEVMVDISHRADFDVIPFTDHPAEKYLTKGTKYTNRSLVGGTDFHAVTEWYNNTKGYSALVILTDGEASVPGKCKHRRIWVLPSGASSQCANGEPVVEVSV